MFWRSSFWNVAYGMWLFGMDSFAEMQAGAVPVLPRNECGAGSAPRAEGKRWRRAGVRVAGPKRAPTVVLERGAESHGGVRA